MAILSGTKNFETDVDRTAADGKTSSVHFLRFGLSKTQITRFRDPGVQVMLGFAHSNYGHLALIQLATRGIGQGFGLGAGSAPLA